MKILVVEDSLLNRMLLLEIVKEYGECDSAVNGEEAVEKFVDALDAGAPYDLVFMDIMMPKMDGHEAIRLIRMAETDRLLAEENEVKIIVLSALDDPLSTASTMSHRGAGCYLTKPFTREKVVEAMEKIGSIAP